MRKFAPAGITLHCGITTFTSVKDLSTSSNTVFTEAFELDKRLFFNLCFGKDNLQV